MRNIAIQRCKFEMDEENQGADAVMSPQPVNIHEKGLMMGLILSLFLKQGRRFRRF